MAPKQPRSPKKDFSHEWKGNHCGVHEAGTYVAKTQAEWTHLWNATHSSSFPAPPAPKLPEGKMAIGIFTGSASQPSTISLESITEKDGNATVHWKSEGYTSMMAVMNEPFLLKFVEKVDGDVRFAKQMPPAVKSKPAYSAPGDIKKLHGPHPF
jgi:hypothetical protein